MAKFVWILVLFSAALCFSDLASAQRVNENIQTAIASQDAEGMTQQNMNIDFLKNLENYIRKQTEVKAQAFLDANGMHKKKIVVKAEGVYIETGGQKLAVIRVSDQFDMSRGVAVHGIKDNQFKRVMCTRATNEPIPISYGLCADKIKEAFGVSLIQ